MRLDNLYGHPTRRSQTCSVAPITLPSRLENIRKFGQKNCNLYHFKILFPKNQMSC